MSQTFDDIIGGKWWKIDFHLHTPGSYDYGYGNESQKDVTPEIFLQCCIDKGLDCIVVTDHDTFKWVPRLQKAAATLAESKAPNYKDITIFPGIEINVQGNVHLLGIFDPEEDYEKLAGLIELLGINKELQTTDKAINDVMNIIISHNGIAIPAHVDAPSGLFGEVSRLPKPENTAELSTGAPTSVIKESLQVNGLLALEVLGTDFHNGQYVDSKLNLTYVVGSDSHTTSTIGDKFTWVKMGKPNIEALRLALYDAQDGAIRSCINSKNPNDITGRTYIKNMEIEQGRYIGRHGSYSISFSPWLNSLIGGRGSGKSTVLKFLRLILNRQDELSGDVLKDFEDFDRIAEKRDELGLLRQETKVSLTMIVEGVEHHLFWKNGTTYEDFGEAGITEASDMKTRFPIRIFSQKQLFEMTKDPHLLFDYLDAEWDSRAWNGELKMAQATYKQCQQKIRTLNEKRAEQIRLSTELRDVEAKIKVFETESTKRVLEESQRLRKCKELVENTYKAYCPFIESINALGEMDLPTDATDFSILDEQSSSTMTEWVFKVHALKTELDAVLKKYEEVCTTVDVLLSRLKLRTLLVENATEIQQVLQKLREAGVDNVNRYEELIKQKGDIEKQLQQYTSVDGDLGEQNALADKQICVINSLIKRRYEARCSVIEKWNKIGNLKLTLEPFQDINENEQAFRKIIRRDSGFDTDILIRDEDTDTPMSGFIFNSCYMKKGQPNIDTAITRLTKEKQKLIDMDESYTKKFTNYLAKTINNYAETMDDFMIWIPEDALSLQIMVSKKFQSVDAGSPGQRTSAILSLIFGISNAPIIIDQPEDDLDTRNITEIVVDGINRIKSKQQIILVTHNPNIVVNTNSEQVVQLDYINGQIVNACIGALQSHDVRDAICEVMEGGKDALQKRYYRIFKALNDN